MTAFETDRLAKLAFIEHHRWWVMYDFAFEKRSQQGFDAALARDIANAYGVVRGFSGKRPRHPAPDASAELIADQVVKAAALPASTLSERYIHLQNALRALRQPEAGDPAVRYDLVSGLSKLLWFALRKDWTMFDDLAAKAIQARGSAQERGAEFYSKLQAAGFHDVVTRIDDWLETSDPAVRQLHGARIVDKYLWLCGADESTRGNTDFNAQFYLEALPPGSGQMLTKLADDFQARFETKLHDFRLRAIQHRDAK